MSEPRVRKCPICKELLEQVALHGVSIDRCQHGTWLDRGELFQLAEAERKQMGTMDRLLVEVKSFFKPQARHEERGEGDTDRDLPCPVCGEDMDNETYYDVYIDRCRRRHGVWLDRGELETILQRLKEDPDFLRGMRLRLSDMQL